MKLLDCLANLGHYLPLDHFPVIDAPIQIKLHIKDLVDFHGKIDRLLTHSSWDPAESAL